MPRSVGKAGKRCLVQSTGPAKLRCSACSARSDKAPTPRSTRRRLKPRAHGLPIPRLPRLHFSKHPQLFRCQNFDSRLDQPNFAIGPMIASRVAIARVAVVATITIKRALHVPYPWHTARRIVAFAPSQTFEPRLFPGSLGRKSNREPDGPAPFSAAPRHTTPGALDRRRRLLEALMRRILRRPVAEPLRLADVFQRFQTWRFAPRAIPSKRRSGYRPSPGAARTASPARTFPWYPWRFRLIGPARRPRWTFPSSASRRPRSKSSCLSIGFLSHLSGGLTGPMI